MLVWRTILPLLQKEIVLAKAGELERAKVISTSKMENEAH